MTLEDEGEGEIKENSQVNEIVSSILKAGLTTIAGRTLLNQLKLIPALSVVASVR